MPRITEVVTKIFATNGTSALQMGPSDLLPHPSKKLVLLQVKRYEDCVQSMHKLEHKISSELCNCPTVSEDESLHKMATDYQSVVYQLGHNTEDLVQLSSKTVVRN